MSLIDYSIVDTVVYEYFTDVIQIRNQQQLTKYLNEYGDNYWELVSTALRGDNEMQVIFRRKKIRV